jgi:hypothetical protein
VQLGKLTSKSIEMANMYFSKLARFFKSIMEICKKVGYNGIETKDVAFYYVKLTEKLPKQIRDCYYSNDSTPMFIFQK